MVRNITRTAITIGALLSVGCREQPTEPASRRGVAELNGLRLELSVDRTLISLGDSGNVTIRLRNETAQAVRLDFGSTCQIVPYIETAAGAIVYPPGGEWLCGMAFTSLTVPAHGIVTRSLVVRGGARADGLAELSLPPGGYRAYARLDATASELRSPTIGFEVR